MDFKLRPFRNNNNAQAGGTLLILMPFVVSILLCAVFVPMGEASTVKSFGLFVPEGYEEMTEAERDNWIIETYGGEPVKEWRWGLGALPSLGEWWLIFPDGTEIKYNDYVKFRDGNALEPDYVQIVGQMITINPPALEQLGLIGVLIRVVLIASICIGLVDLLWLG